MFLLDRVKMAAGSISSAEFNDLVVKMIEVSARINDTWVLRNSPDADPSCIQPSPDQSSFVRCQFHVLYSHSYSVPVLFFNICRPDGKRLGLEEVWSRVPEEYQARIQDHKWATITQQEHPYLGTPFFTLHPCHTASLMSQVPDATDTRYYLIKWLSSVGPVVGLHLPPTYATAFDATGKT
ncbi:ubiquitin-like-conjugating enzyme ATG10 isoform X4 [Littorina saxatilis]|uniref:ubiquitin-like-conjugating enzyme ATG10 isoform X4 n=1 Tax=Littorina saxatilis TaxID=31220 RepID=UPI0038B60856